MPFRILFLVFSLLILPASGNALVYVEDARVHEVVPRVDSIISDVAHGDGVWIATGNLGFILRSETGQDWEVVQPFGTMQRNLDLLAYGAGIWLALDPARPGGSRSMDGGRTWQEVRPDGFPPRWDVADEFRLNGLVFIGDRFFAFGQNGYLIESIDGREWREWPGTPPVHIAYFTRTASGSCVAVSTWTEVFTAAGPEEPWRLVYADRARFRGADNNGDEIAVIIGPSSDPLDSRDRIAFSTNGVHWVVEESDRRFDPQRVHWTEHGLVGLTPAVHSITGNGRNWAEPRPLAVDDSIRSIYRAGGRWFASLVPSGPGRYSLAMSDDLEEWRTVWRGSSDVRRVLSSAAFDGEDTIVAVGNSGSVLRGKVSSDEWEQIVIGGSREPKLDQVFWDGTRFIAYGWEDVLAVSPNGEAWSELVLPEVLGSVYALAGSPGLYLAANIAGEVFRSTDLMTWAAVPREDAAPGAYPAIGYFEGSFVVGSSENPVVGGSVRPRQTWTTTDGINWQASFLNDPMGEMEDWQHIPQAFWMVGGYLAGKRTWVAGHSGSTSVSSDGLTWREIEGMSRNRPAFGQGLLVGSSGAILEAQADVEAPSDRGMPAGFLSNYAFRSVVHAQDRFYFFLPFDEVRSMSLTTDPEAVSPGVIQFGGGELHASEGFFPRAFYLPVWREGGGRGEVSVTIDVEPGGSAAAGTDFIGFPQTVVWKDGETGAKAVTFQPLQDHQIEGDEWVVLALSEATGGAAIGEHSSVTIWLEDGPYEQWHVLHFGDDTTPAALPEGDWDGDGVANFIEFTMRTDPRVPDAERFRSQALMVLNPHYGPVGADAAFPLVFRHDPRIQIVLEISARPDFSDSRRTVVSADPLAPLMIPLQNGYASSREASHTNVASVRVVEDQPLFARYLFFFDPAGAPEI